MTDKSIVIQALEKELVHRNDLLGLWEEDMPEDKTEDGKKAQSRRIKEIELDIKLLESAIDTFKRIEGLTEERVESELKQILGCLYKIDDKELVITFNKDVLHITPKEE